MRRRRKFETMVSSFSNFVKKNDGFCEGKRWIWTQNPQNFPLRGYRGLGNTSYNSYLLNDNTVHTSDWISLLYFAIVPEYSVEKPFAYLLTNRNDTRSTNTLLFLKLILFT